MKKIILISTVIVCISACASPVSQEKATFKMEVNGEVWKCIPSLADSTSDDKHYVVEIDENGAANIIFGDGKQGRRPPTGKDIKLTVPGGRHYSGVYQQQGRMVIDGGWNENGDGKHDAVPPTGKDIKDSLPEDRHYGGVYQQQGRIIIDGDWNESSGISGSLSDYCQ